MMIWLLVGAVGIWLLLWLLFKNEDYVVMKVGNVYVIDYMNGIVDVIIGRRKYVLYPDGKCDIRELDRDVRYDVKESNWLMIDDIMVRYDGDMFRAYNKNGEMIYEGKEFPIWFWCSVC